MSEGCEKQKNATHDDLGPTNSARIFNDRIKKTKTVSNNRRKASTLQFEHD